MTAAKVQAPQGPKSGWVGWPGTLEPYPLQGNNGAVDESALSISVAEDTAAGNLAQLHAGSVWNGAIRMAQLIESGFLRGRLRDKVVLELGAAAALPSLVLMSQHAQDEARPAAVVISDFPSPELLANIHSNIRRNAPLLAECFRLIEDDEVCRSGCLRIVGHEWGKSVDDLRAAAVEVGSSHSRFDAVLVADCLWNEDGHEGLLRTLHAVLSPAGEAWFTHCHHWPGHGEADGADQRFFARAQAQGFDWKEESEFSRASLDHIFGEGPQLVFVHRLWLRDAGVTRNA